MAEFDNNLRGAIFKNDRKEKETHPDYKGSCEIEGTEYWISAWIKEGKSGKFMSLSFTEKEEAKPSKPAKPAAQNKRQPVSSGFDDMDSDIPF